MKKILTFAICLTLIFSVVPIDLFSIITSADSITSGITGECTWELENNVLTIRGQGKMGSYDNYNNAPWTGENITKVIIENGVTCIGYRAFASCTELTSITIPNSVTEIRGNAFSGCDEITTITIPDSVIDIDLYFNPFSYCAKLTTITVDENNPVYHSEGNCVIETKNKVLVAGCKNSAIPEDGSVTRIGNSAFEGCKGLTKITVPNTITSIGYGAFWYCDKLKSIELPNSVKNIGQYAFYHCDKIKSITIPNSVTNIGGAAFDNCYGITTITIPDSVIDLGAGAFSHTGLTTITVDENNPVYHSEGNCVIETKNKVLVAGCKNSAIPEDGSVTSIGASAFAGCKDLTKITIPDGITNIGYMAFSGCYKLKNIEVPNTITQIGSYAFDGTDYYYDKTNWENDVLYISNYLIKAKNSLNGEYKIKDGTRCIADGAFCDCTELKSITIPNGIKYIGQQTFSGCSELTNVKMPDSIIDIDIIAFFKCTKLASITIPNGIKSIGYGAFCDCKELTKIILPESITSIGSEAFEGTGFYCDETNWENDVLYISNYLIKAKNCLSGEYKIKDGTRCIAANAFFDCKELSSITIPKSLMFVGQDAFTLTFIKKVNISDLSAWCNINFFPYSNPLYNSYLFLNDEPLTELVIPENVKSISDYAFYGCNNITSIIIPDSVTSIGKNAFSRCYRIESVTFGKGINKIETGLFNNHVLKKIYIPKNITVICQNAFSDFGSVSDIYYEGTEEEWKKVDIQHSNKSLSTAKLHFNCSGIGLVGDLDGDEVITDSDVLYLLKHTFRPEKYPVNQPCDYDGDGMVTDADAVYLLKHIFRPDKYPLSK